MTRWRVSWVGLNGRLETEVEKSHSLARELSELKVTLQNEHDEHETLRTTVQLVCKDQELTLA